MGKNISKVLAEAGGGGRERLGRENTMREKAPVEKGREGKGLRLGGGVPTGPVNGKEGKNSWGMLIFLGGNRESQEKRGGGVSEHPASGEGRDSSAQSWRREGCLRENLVSGRWPISDDRGRSEGGIGINYKLLGWGGDMFFGKKEGRGEYPT